MTNSESPGIQHRVTQNRQTTREVSKPILPVWKELLLTTSFDVYLPRSEITQILIIRSTTAFIEERKGALESDAIGIDSYSSRQR